ncbi:MAG: hypothetical protein ACJ8AW_31290, partial [Rhodopila sp.]
RPDQRQAALAINRRAHDGGGRSVAHGVLLAKGLGPRGLRPKGPRPKGLRSHRDASERVQPMPAPRSGAG